MTPAAPATDSLPRPHRAWLHRYCILLILALFALIGIGGNVTSLEAGLSVPDGWYTFGYFTPLAPLDLWWHDIATRWEHSHRLQGYVVGILMIGLVGWLWLAERGRPWLPWLGTALLGLVIVQGIMGAARVDQISTTLAIVHGVTGQVILGIAVLIAAATSRVWRDSNTCTAPRASGAEGSPASRGLRLLSLILLGLLVAQLILGALVRHTDAALAIPDFPRMYGGWWPPLDQAALDSAIAAHPQALRPYTVTDVALHLSHRLGAGVILLVSLWLVMWLNLRAVGGGQTRWPARWLMGLLGVQIALGASVVWSGHYPEVATLHQAVGAALLAVATWLAIRVHLWARAPAADTPDHGAEQAESPPDTEQAPEPPPAQQEQPA